MKVGDLIFFRKGVGIIVEQLIPEDEGYRILWEDGSLNLAYEHDLEVVNESR